MNILVYMKILRRFNLKTCLVSIAVWSSESYITYIVFVLFHFIFKDRIDRERACTKLYSFLIEI